MFTADELPDKYDEISDIINEISEKIGTLKDSPEDKVDDYCKDIDSLFKDVQNEIIIFDCSVETISGSEKREFREKSKEFNSKVAE